MSYLLHFSFRAEKKVLIVIKILPSQTFQMKQQHAQKRKMLIVGCGCKRRSLHFNLTPSPSFFARRTIQFYYPKYFSMTFDRFRIAGLLREKNPKRVWPSMDPPSGDGTGFSIAGNITCLMK